ncbi:hypothetical protein D3C75_930060 [compost metagenome]
MRLPRVLKEATCKTTDSISMTNTPPITTKSSSLLVTMAIAPIAPPMPKEPKSPINTLAGWALNTRKPSTAPIIAAAHTPAAIDVACMATTAKAASAMALTPDNNPSTPSVKFTALVTAIIMITING